MLDQIMSKEYYQMGPKRFWLLEYTKVSALLNRHTISKIDQEEVRILHYVGNPDFPKDLYSMAVNCHIIELYNATKETLNKLMLQEVWHTKVPILHANMDLWTSKIIKEKYLKLQIFYVSRDFELKSHLLAIKGFCPCEGLLGDE